MPPSILAFPDIKALSLIVENPLITALSDIKA